MTRKNNKAVPNRNLADSGGKILQSFRHPDDWKDGATTGRSELADKMVLRMNGLHRDQKEKGERQAKAIMEWAQRAGLKPHQLLVKHTPLGDAYLAAPKFFWNEVLERLKTC